MRISKKDLHKLDMLALEMLSRKNGAVISIFLSKIHGILARASRPCVWKLIRKPTYMQTYKNPHDGTGWYLSPGSLSFCPHKGCGRKVVVK